MPASVPVLPSAFRLALFSTEKCVSIHSIGNKQLTSHRQVLLRALNHGAPTRLIEEGDGESLAVVSSHLRQEHRCRRWTWARAP